MPNTKRVYRDSETVKQERLAREQAQIAKREAQTKRLADQALKAQQRLAAAQQRAETIKQHEPKQVGRKAQEPAPTLQQKSVAKFSQELEAVAKDLAIKHGIEIAEISPKIVHRGSGLSISLRGGVAGVKRILRRASDVSREAMRFMQNHSLVGLNKNTLGREVKLTGHDGVFKVAGLKGQSNSIVLTQEGRAQLVLSSSDFKAALIEPAMA